MNYLIEKDGERRHVVSLDKYGDWNVLAEGAGSEPIEHAQFVNGGWTVDEAARAEAQEEALFRGLTPRGLFRRAVRRAKADLIGDMLAEGMINSAMADKLRARLGGD